MIFREMLNKLIRKTKLLNHIVFNEVIKIQDKIIKIPVILGINCELTETWMITPLKHLLKGKEGIFIDVGVNLGQTLIKVKSIESTRKYIGLEPNPTCVFYVKELIKTNQFEDCIILPVGLFTEDSMQILECMKDTEVDSAASLLKNFRSQKIYHKMFVPVFRFQTIASTLTIDKIGIVKIDVEGAELEVVKSLYPILYEHQPIILIEILPVYSNENTVRKKRQEELEQLFDELKYVFFRVNKTDEDVFIGLEKIQNIGIHSDLKKCDYVVVPNESVVTIQHVFS